MGTRSIIARELPNGQFKSVYCHWDGSPKWNGHILLNHYQDPAKVERLLAEGDVSSLREEIGEKHDFDKRSLPGEPGWNHCTFYARDRGESGVDARTHSSFAGLVKEPDQYGAEWLYVLAPDGWRFCPVTKPRYMPKSLSRMRPLTASAVSKNGVNGQRLGLRGLTYHRSSWQGEEELHYVQNGWMMRRRVESGRRLGWEVYRPCDGPDGGDVVMGFGRTRREAAWDATVARVGLLLAEAGVKDYTRFITTAEPGDWTPFAILADNLDEKGVAHPIRELLPRGVTGASLV